MAFCFNGSSSFPPSLVLFPALSVCRYSESFQPSVWQSVILLSLFLSDGTQRSLAFSGLPADEIPHTEIDWMEAL